LVLDKELIADAVYGALPRIATHLRPDVLAALEHAYGTEDDPRGRQVLELLLRNAQVAAEDAVPLCQDTGTVWVCLEVGRGECIPGDVFDGVDEAVARAYSEAHLRMSTLRDALCDRTNLGTNTPAFCQIDLREGSGATLHVMLKGGGSDNASRVVMLPPGAGREGIEEAVLACVREKAANACPPLIIGLGIGTTFDRVGGLAKHALLRRVDEAGRNPDPQVAAFEDHLMELIRATGIGPGALGGSATALAVRVQTAPCHIAALPLAINMGCSAMRSTSIDLASGEVLL